MPNAMVNLCPEWGWDCWEKEDESQRLSRKRETETETEERKEGSLAVCLVRSLATISSQPVFSPHSVGGSPVSQRHSLIHSRSARASLEVFPVISLVISIG